MTTRIERDFSFQAGVYFKENFLMNVYDISLYMEVDTDSIREQNIAMERIKHFLSECLEHSVFVQDTEKKAIERFITCGLKVCTLPEEPYDQIVTLMLLTKLNAITEGRILINDITLGSRLSDQVKFSCGIETPLGPFEDEGWWTCNSTSIMSLGKVQNKKDKIVKLIKPNVIDWNDFDLLWSDKEKKTKQDPTRSEITFISEHEKT